MSKFFSALKRCDRVLLVAMFLLFVLGMTVLYSVNLASDYQGVSLLSKQLLFFCIGLIGFGFFMTVDLGLELL